MYGISVVMNGDSFVHQQLTHFMRQQGFEKQGEFLYFGGDNLTDVYNIIKAFKAKPTFVKWLVRVTMFKVSAVLDFTGIVKGE